jgi:hypothetical protein
MRLLTIRESASELGVTTTLLYFYTKIGLIHSVTTFGGMRKGTRWRTSVLIPETEIRKWKGKFSRVTREAVPPIAEQKGGE